jgi:hypothetical protein
VDGDAELLQEKLPAPGRVDDEPGRDPLLAGRVSEHDRVGAIGREGDVDHVGPEAHVDAGLEVHREQIALERRALELERRVEGQPVGAHLAHLREREALRRVVEEEPHAVLRELMLVEVGLEAEPPDHVVCSDLDRRLTDLVVAYGVSGLEHENPKIRAELQAELSREERSREAMAEDRDVEIVRRRHRRRTVARRGEGANARPASRRTRSRFPGELGPIAPDRGRARPSGGPNDARRWSCKAFWRAKRRAEVVVQGLPEGQTTRGGGRARPSGGPNDARSDAFDDVHGGTRASAAVGRGRRTANVAREASQGAPCSAPRAPWRALREETWWAGRDSNPGPTD